MTPTETQKLQRFLRQRFSNDDITLVARPETKDSVEFQLGGETFGVVYKDDDEGELCYHIQLTVLSEDLD